MNEAIMVAIITAGASVLCQLIIANRNRKDSEIKDAVRDQKIDDRLTAIEKKLDEHNGYAAKIGSLATSVSLMEKDISYLRGGN